MQISIAGVVGEAVNCPSIPSPDKKFGEKAQPNPSYPIS